MFVAKRCLSSRDVQYVIMAARLISEDQYKLFGGLDTLK